MIVRSSTKILSLLYMRAVHQQGNAAEGNIKTLLIEPIFPI